MQQVHHSICAEEGGNYSFHTHKHAQDLTEIKGYYQILCKNTFPFNTCNYQKREKKGLQGIFIVHVCILQL